MTSKIIEYDLCSPGANYDALYEAIKSFGTWAHITESTWFVKTDSTYVQIRDKLLAEMDANDRLFVAELTGAAAWHNVICSNEFLSKHL